MPQVEDVKYLLDALVHDYDTPAEAAEDVITEVKKWAEHYYDTRCPSCRHLEHFCNCP